MFAYLRYFSAISLVLVVVAALGVGVYFRQTAAGDLKNVVEQSSISLTQGYTNTIWHRYKRLFTDILKDVPASEWAKDKRFIRFSKDSFRYFEGIPVAKLNIYTATGERFLSTNQSEIIRVKEEGGLFGGGLAQNEALAQVKDGKVVSRIIPEGGFKAPDGSMTRGSLVQSFIPIMSDSFVPVVTNHAGPKIEAFVEVFYDVTPQWKQLDQFQMVGTTGIIVIFLILFVALIYTAKKAERIIAKQHDKNLELASAKARAEAENMEKSQFLANISHELRTPLNAIIGFSEIIKTQALGPVGNQQYIDYVTDINTSGSHLLSLINDILDYSKAEAGKLELEVSDVDATKLIKSCMRLVQTRAEEAKVNLLENVPKEHYVLSTDAKKLKQILLNLLSNAVKFTPPGGSVTVTAWQNMQDESFTIEVKDTGIGIAPKDISKAMSPFGQVDSELSRKYEGTGLGLPLTKKFTEIMGGTFQIDSALNEGTTISITLPKHAPEAAIKKGANLSKGGEAAGEAEAGNPRAMSAGRFSASSFESAAATTVAAMPEAVYETPSYPGQQDAVTAYEPAPDAALVQQQAYAPEPAASSGAGHPFGSPVPEAQAPRSEYDMPEVQTPHSGQEFPNATGHAGWPAPGEAPPVAYHEEGEMTPEQLGFPAAMPFEEQEAPSPVPDQPVPETMTPEALGFPAEPLPEAASAFQPAIPEPPALSAEMLEHATPEQLGFPPAEPQEDAVFLPPVSGTPAAESGEARAPVTPGMFYVAEPAASNPFGAADQPPEGVAQPQAPELPPAEIGGPGVMPQEAPDVANPFAAPIASVDTTNPFATPLPEEEPAPHEDTQGGGEDSGGFELVRQPGEKP